MKILPLFLAAALAAQEPSVPEKATLPLGSDPEKSVLFIDPKNRANDYMQAFELLHKDKPTLKINLRTKGGMTIQVNEMTASSSGTLIFAKVPANSGSKYLIIPIEEIAEVSYSAN